jgi:putative restriction endonuclease
LRDVGCIDILVTQAVKLTGPNAVTTYWWVNHKQTFKQEVDGNYLWSPVTRSDGGRNEFYDNMKRIQPGDVVFSFASALIQAVGVCVGPAILAPKPSEFSGAATTDWQNEGWRVPVRFARLQTALRPKDHMGVLAPTLPDKYSPIQANGNGNQVAYLALVPDQMAEAVIRLIGPQWSSLDLEIDAAEQDTSAEEDALSDSIRNRTDIGETEKTQLVKARRGQGIYRTNLEAFEIKCRVTGVTNKRHLRASHIKPWRMSTDFEKLDGNNGLLLSPHIDHLFDQGFISFKDNGELIVSPAAAIETPYPNGR